MANTPSKCIAVGGAAVAEQHRLLLFFYGKMFKKPPINEMINSLTTLTFVLIL